MGKKEIMNNRFADLTDTQTHVLCYVAFTGETYGASSSEFSKSIKLTSKKFEAVVDKLKEAGYLIGTNTVKPERYFDILYYLATERQGWLDEFKQLGRHHQTQQAEYLWKIAELVRNEEFDQVRKVTRPLIGWGYERLTIYPYISKKIPDDERYIKILDSEQLRQVCVTIIPDYFAKGILSGKDLETLSFLIDRFRMEDGAKLKEQLSVYGYFLNGSGPALEHPASVWGDALNAIRELYTGQMEDALVLFRKTLKRRGKKTECVPSPLVCFFMSVCILRYITKYGAENVADLIADFRMASPLKYDSKYFASSFLLEYALANSEAENEAIKRRLNRLPEYATNRESKCLAYLLACFFDAPKDVLEEIGRTETGVQILTYELSPYQALDTSTREDLSMKYGPTPLLNGIRRKTNWDVILGEIETKAVKKVDERPRRIIYFMKQNFLSTIMEQVLTDDGNWSDAQMLSIKTMCNEGYDSMDLADSRIAMQLNRKELWQDDASILIPNLYGTGRCFVGNEFDTDRKEAIIVKEAPFVEFKGVGSEIVVLSNVRETNDGKPRKHTVSRQGATYKVVSINPVQADVLGRLFRNKAFPIEAAQSIRKIIEQLKSVIEVHEDALLSTPDDAVESCGQIVVRIEPVGLDYKVTLLTAPLSDGISRFIPAKGDEYVYDENADGKTICVHRNFEAEEYNYQDIVNFTLGLKYEFESYNECLVGSEHALLYLLEYCHDNPDRFICEWPQGNRLKFKGIISKGDINIDIKSDTKWFHLDGTVTLSQSKDKVKIEDLLNSICGSSDDEFIRIGENEYARMSDTLRKHLAELDAILRLSDDGKKEKRLPKFLVGALANVIEGLNHNTDTGYRNLMDKMKQAYASEIPVPEDLKAMLRPYQADGYRWMCRLDKWGAGACLADDMGLGKTVQAIAFLLYKKEKGASLVVAPKSVIPNWSAELERFAPSLKVILLNDESDRARAVSEAGAGCVVLSTYGVLTTSAALLAEKHWSVACLDEAHQIKNRTTLVSQAAMDLNAASRIILTGTPLQNHLGDLWNLMQFINPGLLGRWNIFRDTYINHPFEKEHREMLRDMTNPFILRRTKQEVLTELPEKVETTRYVELSENETKIYEALRQRASEYFNGKHKGKDKDDTTVPLDFFSELMKLRVACCDMKLVYDVWKEPSSKVTSLTELLETLLSVPTNNVLVFSQFTSFLEVVRTELDKEGRTYAYLDGQTSMKNRRRIVEDFQNGKERLFLSSLKAGGLGINLTAANYVILTDPWWNPAIEDQAADRAHRIGQKRCVSVIRMICQNTIEEKILKLHEKKRELTEEILNGTAESYKLTYEDILDMVAPF